MDILKTQQKLEKLSDSDLKKLLKMVHNELSERSEYLSNTENSPSEQSSALGRMFSQAWIH